MYLNVRSTLNMCQHKRNNVTKHVLQFQQFYQMSSTFATKPLAIGAILGRKKQNQIKLRKIKI